MAKKKDKLFPDTIHLAFENEGTDERYSVVGKDPISVINGMTRPAIGDETLVAEYQLIAIRKVKTELKEAIVDVIV